MLIVSLMATLAGLVFVFLDYNQYQPDLPKLKSMVTAPMGGPPVPPVGGNPPAGAPKSN
jgi:hypothetical protein